ncbi:surface antigen protein 2 [Angomonas deanei]|uniref:Leucine rich repeat, putative n=1 Tax=Angomonas deanei TaxID=59799 RepID=A0A7G2C3D9_9TRYP|nr:surface antigen protein 2 [Angomonas deanei]CAD2213661.1 Leucine rich repeat, putative [Angomonas deanei]|eukprot:EPY17205.1 surface antigen protein 2 [Angomonas deanei]
MAKGVSGTLSGGNTLDQLTVLIVHGSLTGSIPDRYQFVKTLDLFGNNIKEFDAQKFDQLDIVNLSNNAVGSLSNFWGTLTTPKTYTTVDLSHNLLKSVDENIYAKSLTFLNISHNEILQVISKDWISGVTTLRTLDMSNNEFSGAIGADYFPSGMTTLVLSHNQLSGTVPTFSSVEYLYANDNQITGIGSDFFSKLPAAKVVDLSNNPQLYGTATLGDSAIPFATELHLDNTDLAVNIKANFWSKTKLKILTAANARSVAFHDLPEGAVLPDKLPDSLEYLDLSNVGLDGPLPEGWSEASSNLQSVKLGGNHFTNCIPDAWENHPALKAASKNINGLKTCAEKKKEDDKKAKELSGGAIAGIVVGCVVFILLILILVWWRCFHSAAAASFCASASTTGAKSGRRTCVAVSGAALGAMRTIRKGKSPVQRPPLSPVTAAPPPPRVRRATERTARTAKRTPPPRERDPTWSVR